MKLVYVCDAPLSGIGGANKSVITTCTGMARRGNDVRILLVGKPDNFKVDGCSIDFFDQHFFYGQRFLIAKLWRMFFRCIVYYCYFRKSRAELVHVHSSSSAKFISVLIHFGLISNQNKRFIFSDRQYFEGYEKRNQAIYRKYFNSWDKVICTTENNRKAWLKAVGFDQKYKISVISNALENSWFVDNSKVRQLTRQSYEILDNEFVIGFAGRYEDWKRWDTAIEIIRSTKDLKNLRVAIAIGDGSSRDMMQQVVSSIMKITNGRAIIYKNVAPDKMVKFYSLLDLFILTSENESFGRTLIEAMTQHTAVIGTNSGGVPNVLNFPDDLFDVGDVNAGVKLVRRYYSDQKLLKSRIDSNFNYASKMFREDQMITRTESIYKELVYQTH